jgi:hypothetical protein
VNTDILALGQGTLRGTDSNSLLRMYDLIRAIIGTSPLQHDRERAGRILGRIAKELQKRQVHL